MNFDVNEIFYSIEGEGIRAGLPSVFIRFNGCNLRCSYCDTCYAQEEQGTYMTLEEIMNKVRSFGCKNVTLTGGEPLLQEDINSLVLALYENHYWVNIETNGSVKYTGYQSSRITITKDYKCGTSNMNSKMSLDMFDDIYSEDVIKFVVGSKEDMEQALSFYRAYKNEYPRRTPFWFFSPVFGQIEPKDIAAFLKEHHLDDVRLQLQLHKIIWDPEERGV